MGPEERERFARREELGVPPVSPRRDREPEQRTLKAVAGGSITEAICGAATVVLAIIGLAGALPGYLASIATIVFGVALIAEGGAVAARHRGLVHELTSADWSTRTELGGGVGAEFLAGAAGIVLGILGLIGLATGILIPIAIIAFGGALLLGSGTTLDLGSTVPGSVEERYAHITRQATVAASGAQVLLGVAAIVLGILALVGLDPLLLTLVALIVLGASVFFSGSAISSRLGTVLLRHHH